MTLILGKRKRKAGIDRITESSGQRSSDGQGVEDVQAIFRRHFEAQFKPLKITPVATQAVEARSDTTNLPGEEGGENENKDSSWDGFSSEEADDVVEVVDHDRSFKLESNQSKGDLRGYMSSKPPRLKEQVNISTEKSRIVADSNNEDEVEALNLKNDVALQQLLRESHLLDPSTGNRLNPTGNNRHKALDLRLRAMGTKTSIFTQEKMPMAHRKGMAAKAKLREDKRRQQAKENGIILEKATKSKKREPHERRERGVGAPSVGKFRGGTLSLSQSDLREIQGTQASHGKRRRR